MILRHRKYRTGTRFGIWLWTFVGYVTRLHLIKTPWFGVYLHWFNHPDPYPNLHDHPVNFVSFCLRGAYIEQLIDGEYRGHFAGQIRLIRMDHCHKVVEVMPRTLTLCINGRATQVWGHLVDGKKIPWQEYQRTIGASYNEQPG